jgi:glycosyltransferase involved in cell wall biosynthesis
MTRKPRLLFFAYAFRPSQAIGAVRCWNIAKHLGRRGWDVEVVTLRPELLAHPEPGLDIHPVCEQEKIRLRGTDCGGRLLSGGWLKLRWWQPRLLAGLARRGAAYLGMDCTHGWIAAAERACAPLRAGDVDAIYASAPPYTGFEAAARVARRLGTPLVLDYRDLWSQNPYYENRDNQGIRRREEALLAQAWGVTTVAPSMADCLRGEFNLVKPLAVVTNGFDTEDFVGIEPAVFEDFAMVYAGRFYPPGQTATPLIAAVAQANKASSGGRPFRLHYYGPDGRDILQLARDLGAVEWVKDHGKVPRSQVLAALKGADLAAVITTVKSETTPAENGVLTGKLFEAIGAGTPILVVAPKGSDISRLVMENNLGMAFPADAVAEMGDALVRQKSGARLCRSKESEGLFSWPTLAGQLDRFLRQAACV